MASIRIDIQLDHRSESLRYVATATLGGKRHEPFSNAFSRLAFALQDAGWWLRELIPS